MAKLFSPRERKPLPGELNMPGERKRFQCFFCGKIDDIFSSDCYGEPFERRERVCHSCRHDIMNEQVRLKQETKR
jgi:hypothetical protein